MSEFKEKLFVSLGLRNNSIKSPKKMMLGIIFLNADGGLGNEPVIFYYESNKWAYGTAGKVYKAEFNEEGQKKIESTFISVFGDQEKVEEWQHLEEEAIKRSNAKFTNASTALLSDLIERLGPERKSYQAAIKRRDFEAAEAVILKVKKALRLNLS